MVPSIIQVVYIVVLAGTVPPVGSPVPHNNPLQLISLPVLFSI